MNLVELKKPHFVVFVLSLLHRFLRDSDITVYKSKRLPQFHFIQTSTCVYKGHRCANGLIYYEED